MSLDDWEKEFEKQFARYVEAYNNIQFSGIGNLQPFPNCFKLFGDHMDLDIERIALAKFKGFREVNAWRAQIVLYRYCEIAAMSESSDFFTNIKNELAQNAAIVDMINNFNKQVEDHGVPIEIQNANTLLSAIANLIPEIGSLLAKEESCEQLAALLHVGIRVYSEAKPFIIFKEYNEGAPIKIEFQKVPNKSGKLLMLYDAHSIGRDALARLLQNEEYKNTNLDPNLRQMLSSDANDIAADMEVLSNLRTY